MNHDHGCNDPRFNSFLVDSATVVREMVELAVVNWMSSQNFGADDRARSELAALAGQFLEDTKRLEECWTTASRCAASGWGNRPVRDDALR
jgi:hypothetical protein